MSRLRQRSYFTAAGLMLAACLAGCKEPISIQPSCPATLAVGESDQLFAQAQNAGAIAAFRWEVIPPQAGEIDNPEATDPIFTAREEGLTFLRLTASDGLFQVVSECSTQITAADKVLILFEADPATAGFGDPVTLTCKDAGGVEIVDFAVTQTDGTEVDLTPAEEGVFEFDAPQTAGPLAFECVASDADGNESDPASVTVTVEESGG